MTRQQALSQKISHLPPQLIQEVANYVDFLIEKNDKTEAIKKGRFSFDWAGGLSDLSESSVELQKKALDWRNDDETPFN